MYPASVTTGTMGFTPGVVHTSGSVPFAMEIFYSESKVYRSSIQQLDDALLAF